MSAVNNTFKMEQDHKTITEAKSGEYMPLSYAGFSRKLLLRRLIQQLGMSEEDANMRSRLIRLLWFMRMMGWEWVNMEDLRRVGAGLTRHYKYMLPDGVKTGVLESVNAGNCIRYRATELGRAYLLQAEALVAGEILKSAEKCRKWAELREKRRLKGLK